MSKESISNKANIIRNETEKGRNTGARIAGVIDDINETKIDQQEVESSYVQKVEFTQKISEVESSVQSGIKGVLKPDTPYDPITNPYPTPWVQGDSPLYEKYDVNQAGAFPNTKDAADENIIVTQNDLDLNEVQIWIKNGVAEVVKKKLPQATNNIPQFENLQFPVVNTLTEKVQTVYEFSQYQLKDGETATIADIPGESDIWKKIKSGDTPLESLISAKDQQMRELGNSNRFVFTADTVVEWVRVNESGNLGKVTLNAHYYLGRTRVQLKVFTNHNELADPFNSGFAILDKVLTKDDYIDLALEEATLYLDVNVLEGNLIAAVIFDFQQTENIKFTHYYYGGNPYPNGTPFYWRGDSASAFQAATIGSGGSYYQIPIKLETKFELDQKVFDLESVKTARMVLPSKLYAIVGKEFNLYFDAFIMAPDQGTSTPNYLFSILCPIGGTNERSFRVTPDDSMIGQHVFTVNVYDNYARLIETKEVQLIVVNDSNPATQKRILCLGDSTTDDTAEVVFGLNDNFDLSGGIKPILVGHKPYHQNPTINHGASSGKTFDFFANGMQVLKFNVTGLPASGLGVYPNLTLSLPDGSGYLVAIRTDVPNDGSGTGTIYANVWNQGSTNIGAGFTGQMLTNSAAGWSNLINVASTEELLKWSPIRFGGQIDFQQYADSIGLGANKIDLLSIDLGINDCRGLVQPNAARQLIIDNAKKIAKAFRAYNNTGKVMFCLPKSCANPRSLSSLHHDTYRLNIHALRENLILNFDQNADFDYCFVSNSGLSIDRFFGYPKSSVKAAERFSDMITVATDDLHPIREGYEQVADAMVAAIIANL